MTTTTTTPVALTLNRAMDASRAMDSALNAARYTSYSNDTGKFDPLKASRLRRKFDQYKRSVLLSRNRVPSDAALISDIARLIDRGNVPGVYHATEKWLGVL